jgi:hypothetical protein
VQVRRIAGSLSNSLMRVIEVETDVLLLFEKGSGDVLLLFEKDN